MNKNVQHCADDRCPSKGECARYCPLSRAEVGTEYDTNRFRGNRGGNTFCGYLLASVQAEGEKHS